jgi:sulfur transfer complex TusBCD TusB component (DsrH family)
MATNLSDSTYEAGARSVFVQGADIYVAGLATNGSGITIATLWKNGIVTNLTTLNSLASSVYVKGPDVYVAGQGADPAYGNKYINIWKNGAAAYLTNSSLNAIAESVYANGPDVYAAGVEIKEFPGGPDKAVLWKNGVVTYLTNGTYNAIAWSVVVK